MQELIITIFVSLPEIQRQLVSALSCLFSTIPAPSQYPKKFNCGLLIRAEFSLEYSYTSSSINLLMSLCCGNELINMRSVYSFFLLTLLFGEARGKGVKNEKKREAVQTVNYSELLLWGRY